MSLFIFQSLLILSVFGSCLYLFPNFVFTLPPTTLHVHRELILDSVLVWWFSIYIHDINLKFHIQLWTKWERERERDEFLQVGALSFMDGQSIETLCSATYTFIESYVLNCEFTKARSFYCQSNIHTLHDRKGTMAGIVRRVSVWSHLRLKLIV